MVKLFDLHKDVLRQILFYCNLQDIFYLALMSKKGSELLNDDEFWRGKLMRDFYFTQKGSENIRLKIKNMCDLILSSYERYRGTSGDDELIKITCNMDSLYKLVYQYCKEYELNYIQKILCGNKEVEGIQYINRFFRGRHWFIEKYQSETFLYLIKKSRKTINDVINAIDKIEELNEDECYEIRKEIVVEDTDGASEFEQFIRAKCRDRKTSVDMLLSGIEIDGVTTCYGGEYFERILNRIIDEFLSYKRNKGEPISETCLITMFGVLNVIDGLTYEQASAFSMGASRDDVIGLSFWQLFPFRMYQGHLDLTGNHFRGCDWFNSFEHHCALGALCFNRDLTVDQAMTEMNNLTKEEVLWIGKGYMRDNAIELEKSGINKFIKHLCAKMADHDLHDWIKIHEKVLYFFIIKCRMTVCDTMDKMNKLTKEEAYWISKGFEEGEAVELANRRAKRFLEVRYIELTDNELDSVKNRGDNLIKQGYITHELASNEDCGYAVFGFTKESALQLLKENVISIRGIIKYAVHEALFTKNFYNYLIDKQLISSDVTHEYIVAHLNQYNTNTTVQLGYLQYDVCDKNIDIGWPHPCVLQALAYIQKIELHMWRLQDKYGALFYTGLPMNHPNYIPQIVALRIDLLFFNDSNNHFNQLTFEGYKNEIPKAPIYPIGFSPNCKSCKFVKLYSKFLHLFVVKHHMTVYKAMTELGKLTKDQAWGMSKGLSKEDVIGLSHFQIKALRWFKKKSFADGKLTANHLCGHDWFNSKNHILALDTFAIDDEDDEEDEVVTVSEAMDKIKELSEEQCYGIYKEFSAEDTVGLSFNQIDALENFETKGLTAECLQKCDWFNSTNHVKALTYLLENRHMPIESAMLELEGLNSYEAEGVSKGFFKEDVIGLSPVQIKALIKSKESNGYNANKELSKRFSREELTRLSLGHMRFFKNKLMERDSHDHCALRKFIAELRMALFVEKVVIKNNSSHLKM